MSLPTSYLTSTKNLAAILESIQQAKAPERFTVRFLQSLEYKSTPDRLIIGVLKMLKFLDDQGKPIDRYFRFLDQTQSSAVMAEAIKDAYADLFQVNTKAYELSKQQVKNKFKTLSQGQISESVLDKMGLTFTALVKLGDFSSTAAKNSTDKPQGGDPQPNDPPDNSEEIPDQIAGKEMAGTLGGLHYNIQIILPESRDPKVYDALFRSLREHLFDR